MELLKVNDEFLVNTIIEGDQHFPIITDLANGNFVVSWRSYFDSGNGVVKGRMFQIFDAFGEKISEGSFAGAAGEVQLNGSSITDLSDGGFVVTWLEGKYTLGDAGELLNVDMLAQRYGANGDKIGGAFQVNTSTVAKTINYPAITGLVDGGFVVSWTEAEIKIGESPTYNVKAQIFGDTGSKVGGEILVGAQRPELTSLSKVTSLVGGGFVLTWASSSPALGSDIRAQVFGAKGEKLGNEFVVNAQTQRLEVYPQITGLADGGFVVSWFDYIRAIRNVDDLAIRAQVFGPTGGKVGDELLVDTHLSGAALDLSIAGLSDGGFVLTWADFASTLGDKDWTGIKAQVFGANGVKVGNQFLVNTQTAGAQRHPSIAGLTDGNFVVTWSDYSGTLGDNSRASVKAQIFAFEQPKNKLFDNDPNEVNFNTLNIADFKGPFNNAGGGDDTVTLPVDQAGITKWGITGSFHGGDGDDTISAGTAAAMISGDAGDDTILGGAGNDTLAGGAGVDTLDGKGGDDTFLVSDADLVLETETAPTDIYDGGDDADKADFSSTTTGVSASLIEDAAQANAGLNFLNVEHFIGGSGKDTLTLLGGTQELDDVTVTYGSKDGRPSFNESSVEIYLQGSDPNLEPGKITLEGVEKIHLAGGINNEVNLSSSKGSLTVEMLKLAKEVYGPIAPLHIAEGLAYQPNPLPSTPSSVSQFAVASGRNWHAVQSLELGIAPADDASDENPNLRFSFIDGVYQAYDQSKQINFGTFLDHAMGTAMVLSGVVRDASGRDVKTLAIAFRGTDQAADAGSFANFATAYNLFRPLVAGLIDYLDENSVDQVLISGHSLGGALAEYLAYDLKSTDWAKQGHEIEVFTIGSPGSERLPNELSSSFLGVNQQNFVNVDDPVPFIGMFTNDIMTRTVVTVIIDSIVFATDNFSKAKDVPGKFLKMKDYLNFADAAGNLSAKDKKAFLDTAKELIDDLLGVFDKTKFVHNLLQSIEPKYLHGSRIEISHGDKWAFSKSAHNADGYVKDIEAIYALSNDLDGPFSKSKVGTALRSNTVYDGDAVRINIGDGGGRINVGVSDSWALGSNATNDEFRLGNEDKVTRRVDGGGGVDKIIFDGKFSGYSIGKVNVDGGIDITLRGSRPDHIAVAYRIERFVFDDRVVDPTGKPLAVDRPSFVQAKALIAGPASADVPPPSPLVFRLSSGFDYADAGNGAMTVVGTRRADIIYTGSGSKTVNGGAGNDIIISRASTTSDSNRIDGGAGADSMFGGRGNDTYIVDNNGDEIEEAARSGNDSVLTKLTEFQLGDNVENLQYTGNKEFYGSGNAADNTIRGGASVNTLIGLEGNDRLIGGKSDDYLSGGRGNDTLTGGAGNDTLTGGLGDDRFEGGNGIDTADYSAATRSVSVSLAVAIAQATGGAGSDTLISVENIVGTKFADELSGNGGNNRLTGGAGRDILSGARGDDTLVGGAGADTYIGGAGSDVFAFDTLTTSSNRDTVMDFLAGFDQIGISRSAFTAFASNQAGALDPSAFVVGTAATSSQQHLVYNNVTGVLSYDADGAGGQAQVQLAILSSKPALSATDFVLL